MNLYQVEQKAIRDHAVTHHRQDGKMWSSCKCGWESRKRNAYDNYQVTGSIEDGVRHQSCEAARARSAYRSANRNQ